jgi:UDP-hydrolysing UDP-N-acetyl-D-glucosamine 2-epimerase
MARIAVVVTARPSWSKLQPVCEALKARPDVELQIIACASALLERYGKVVDVIKAQGFTVTEEVWSTYEGANLVTGARETGALLEHLCGHLSRLQPGCVVCCADRHEVLAVAQAGAYLHLPVAHLQGGERTGSIDDRVRDSITALSDYHFTATERAKYRVVGLTGAYDRVWNVGCPSIDLAKRALCEPPVTNEELGGAGPVIDFEQPFVIVLQHPDTRFHEDAHAEMVETLEGIAGHQAIVFWPGQDAGMEGASKAIRDHRGLYRTVRNLPPARYLRLLGQAACLVGNSSSGVRESAFLGTPVVNVGLRQWGRERAANVLDGPHDREWIREAVKVQMACGRYPSSLLYGRGDAGEQIAERLMHVCAGTDPGALR